MVVWVAENSHANLRDMIGGKKIGELRRNDAVHLIEIQSDGTRLWGHVNTKVGTGWIWLEFLASPKNSTILATTAATTATTASTRVTTATTKVTSKSTKSTTVSPKATTATTAGTTTTTSWLSKPFIGEQPRFAVGSKAVVMVSSSSHAVLRNIPNGRKKALMYRGDVVTILGYHMNSPEEDDPGLLWANVLTADGTPGWVWAQFLTAK